MSGSGDPAPARVALVTGASRGIGRELAVGLARAGLDVAVLGRDEARLRETAETIEAAGARATVMTADVRDLEQVRAAVGLAEAALGPIDLLVNNAGVIERDEVPVWDADPGEWWDVVEANVRGPFHCVRAVVPGMVERGRGRVVDLASGSSTRDSADYSAYYVSKTALLRLGGSLHAAGYDRGVRAFEVAPGVVRTRMTGGMAVHADRTEWTEVADVVELVVACARGDLDEWSGRFLRAGADDVETLRARAADRPEDARTLRVRPYGDDDPLV